MRQFRKMCGAHRFWTISSFKKKKGGVKIKGEYGEDDRSDGGGGGDSGECRGAGDAGGDRKGSAGGGALLAMPLQLAVLTRAVVPFVTAQRAVGPR